MKEKKKKKKKKSTVQYTVYCRENRVECCDTFCAPSYQNPSLPISGHDRFLVETSKRGNVELLILIVRQRYRFQYRYLVLNKWTPAAEIGRNPASKHQIQPEYGDEQADAGRDGRTRLARPNAQARTGTEKY